MKHSREDYNRIQDPAGLIPEEEPVFLIRAQDITAARIVDFWADLAEAHGAAKDIVSAARIQVEEIEKWQACHAVKVPDMPQG